MKAVMPVLSRVLHDLSRIFSLTKPYRKRLYVAILLSVLAASVTLVIPLGLRGLINAVFEEGNRGMLNLIAGGLFVLFMLHALFSFWGGYWLRWTGERVIADLRNSVYQHLQRLSLRYHANERIGDITSRLTNDVGSVRRAATSVFSAMLRQGLSLIGSIALMVALNWRLSIAVLLVVPPAGIAARYFGQRVRTFSRRVQDRLADSTAVAEEALSAIWVVKAFARTRYECERYREAVEDVFESSRHRALLAILLSTIVGFAFYAALAGIFWFGGLEVLAGRLTAGDLVAFIFYALAVSRSTRVLAQVYSTINQAIGASERLFELLDTTPEIQDAPNALMLPTADGHVSFEDVTFGYDPESPILHNVSFSIRPGQTHALVGPSGAGKTTILRLMPRFYDPTGGRITIDGYDLRDVKVESLRRQIAIVSQDIHLFNLSVRDNICYGCLNATQEAIEAAAQVANAHGFISNLPDGYATGIGEKGVKLSGGQRQRIALARAVLNDARLLLLDEPMSGLDSKAESLVQEALQRVCQDRTTLTITHRLASVQQADSIMVIEKGRIVEHGTHTDLLAHNGLYREMLAYQFHGAEHTNGSLAKLALPA